jgi:hypothetical protein
MTSRRSPPRRSSGSRAASALVAVGLLLGLTESGAPGGETKALARASSALVERRDGVEVDWVAGTMTASGGAAADLHMPGADLARPGAVRRAEAVARERLGRALAELPLGGDRKLAAAAVERALSRARTIGTDYQSNGGALVRVSVRFVDWIDPAPSRDAPVVLSLAVPAMPLGASPVAKIGDTDHALGAAVYRLGAPPDGARTVPAKLDRSGRLVIDAKRGAPFVEKLAGGAALIYVGKVLK